MKIKELEKRIKELEDENMVLGRRERFKGVEFYALSPYYNDPFYHDAIPDADVFEIKFRGCLRKDDAKFLVNKINELLDRIRKGEVR